MSARVKSWGGSQVICENVRTPQDAGQAMPGAEGFLAIGAGRSFGDTCLPAGGVAIDMRRMNRIIGFDIERGVLHAQAGINLGEILDAIVPHGWFLPVTPGTQFVTLGGAIANDVHGKNHHGAGTFGRHVRNIELLRSGRGPITCSRDAHAGMFAATIGGMGLTGVIAAAEIQLMRVASPDIEQRTIAFANIGDFFARLAGQDTQATYSVAWIDGLSGGASLGRGLLMLGEHATPGERRDRKTTRALVPFTPPFNVVPRFGLRVMNAAYLRIKNKPSPHRVGYGPYFYPLDGIENWNRLYGPRGFHQFQCVVPLASAREALTGMLALAHRRAGGSGLVVLKCFGDVASPGMLSFPMQGYTLTMDFPDRGEPTLAMLRELDQLALEAGGRVNPYKDRRMSRDTFEKSFPHWREILPFLDPHAESIFSRRIGLTQANPAKDLDRALTHS